MKINVYELDKLSKSDIEKILIRSESDIERFQEIVRPIIDDVRKRGDNAIVEYSQKFDKVSLNPLLLKVTNQEFEDANKTLDSSIKEVIEASAKNIKKFHKAQMPEEMWFSHIDKGIMAGEKITPITSVGIYVPRGKGSFPSVMLMLCIPVSVAEVPEVIVCTPPTPEGKVDDASLFAAQICGIKNIYKVGGAQAIAAMAFGTQSIPKVNKVIGPGNPYVSAAKRLLYGKIDVGTPAGPSESIILCDETTNPKKAALDLLIEAEHGPDSTALLVTHSREIGEAVKTMLPDLINDLPEERKNFCQNVFSNYGGIVITRNIEQSIKFVNDFAPEHLEVLTNEPMSILPEIKNAGEILLGEYSPITIGNFSLGVNAILPTGGFAKTFSCVTVYDFLKRSSIGYLTKEGYESLKDIAMKFAEYEGFPSHANAIKKRG
ncbi:MAG: histidinol dehydrogenase [Desulfobacterales bacterium]|nr:histidinol dehydrogenase [Desulfobacterales bacterium]MBF0395443.1 histidinol dehydrogenase [Desulfobacterales bacterium]